MIKIQPNPKYASYIQCDRCGRRVYTSESGKQEIHDRFSKGGWTFIGEGCRCRECSKAVEDEA